MREIEFYRTASGRCPLEEFLDTLSDKQAEKILWVLRLVKNLDPVPRQYFKLLSDTDGIWEVRVKLGGDIFRLLGFFAGPQLLVFTLGFVFILERTTQKEI